MTPTAVAGSQDAAAQAPPKNLWANVGRLKDVLAVEARAPAASAAATAGGTQPAVAAHQTPPEAHGVAQTAQAAPLPELAAPLTSAAVPLFERRGFVNSGNLCFANATLQALLGLEPFVALLQHLSTSPLPLSPSTSTLRSLAALAREFAPEAERAPARAPPRSNKGALCLEDVLSPFLETFDASVGTAAATSARGARQAARRVRQQQDAHEFMSSLLDHAHMVRQQALPTPRPRMTRAAACRSWCSCRVCGLARLMTRSQRLRLRRRSGSA